MSATTYGMTTQHSQPRAHGTCMRDRPMFATMLAWECIGRATFTWCASRREVACCGTSTMSARTELKHKDGHGVLLQRELRGSQRQSEHTHRQDHHLHHLNLVSLEAQHALS
ncbi:hypothetical protein F511_21949 [Dorcoceras hygrometricum]|uniref:Uncharacterized protein n=1 Tax=Dorcoceras hygrometricum TaxID=472368 RepID=A0A2Z7A3X1_9LAMI|nr:hypothetical protein F511_21949 [Dorcoceras hygrometricum]